MKAQAELDALLKDLVCMDHYKDVYTSSSCTKGSADLYNQLQERMRSRYASASVQLKVGAVACTRLQCFQAARKHRNN